MSWRPILLRAGLPINPYNGIHKEPFLMALLKELKNA